MFNQTGYRVSLIVTLCLSVGYAVGMQGNPPIVELRPDMSEAEVINIIKKLSEVDKPGLSVELRVSLYGAEKVKMMEAIDHLTKYHPTSGFVDDALILKLQTLAEMSRVSPEYLDILRKLCTEIRTLKPRPNLAAHVDFYDIQAFVLAARNEDMDEKLQLLGAAERYERFLKDHKSHSLEPVVWGSLIRNLIQRGENEKAKQYVKALRMTYPEHPAYQRAAGEVARLDALGNIFGFEFRQQDGTTVKSTDFRGKVLVLHFWASWEKQSCEQANKLRKLLDRYQQDGLAVVGVSCDKSRELMQQAMEVFEMNWPTYFDGKGMKNDLLVAAGITGVPTTYVIDPAGILVNDNPWTNIEEVLQPLLAKVEKPAEPAPAGSEPATKDAPSPAAPPNKPDGA